MSTTLEATIFRKILQAAGLDVSVAPLHGGPHVLTEAFTTYLGRGYRAKLVEYPTFDLQLMKRSLQRTAVSVKRSLDPFSMTENEAKRPKCAETRYWMASRPALRKGIITNDLSMPGLVDVVSEIVEVRPLVVSYPRETGRKYNKDSFVLRSSILGSLICDFTVHSLLLHSLEEKDERVSVPHKDQLARIKFRLFHLLL